MGGAGATTWGTSTPTSATPGVPGVVASIGGTDMEISGSSTSIAGSINSNMVPQSSSPSPGPFKNLSSKLAVNTFRKLSVSQKSLFSASKEDLLAGNGGGSIAGCQCLQENNAGRENLSEAGGVGGNNEEGAGSGCCYCCYNHHGVGGGSIYSEGDPIVMGNGPGSVSGSSRVQKMQSKLNSLRGVTGSKRYKDKNKKSSRKSRDMEYNYSSQFVREEFAQYNNERQIEDFQRAARVFKEQKALTTAAAAASIAAEARAAIVEAAAAAAEAAAKQKKSQALQQSLQHSDEKSFSSSSTSLAIATVNETEDESNRNGTQQSDTTHRPCSIGTSCKNSLENLQNTDPSGNSSALKGLKKSIVASTRSGLLRSVSRPHRRVGSSTKSSSCVGSDFNSKVTATTLTSRKSYGYNIFNTGGSLNGKTDASYLELGQVGMGMGMDLKLPRFGFSSNNSSSSGAIGFDAIGFDPFNNESTSTSKGVSALDVLATDFEDIPLNDMTKATSPTMLLSMEFPRKPEDVYSFKGRTSSVSQDSRGAVGMGNVGIAAGGHSRHPGNLNTGRSAHSICSVDTVSQQISERHRQHSLAASNLSNVASLRSQSQALHSNCDTIATGTGVAAGGGMGGVLSGAGMILENSPIQVVRATVGTVDDPSLPCFTFRMWVLSTIFIVMGAAISEYNFFRSNSAYFSIYFVQLASYFCGKAMAKVLPVREFEIRVPDLGRAFRKWCGWSSSQENVSEYEVGINSDDSTLSGNGRRIGSQLTGGPIRGTDRSGLSRSNVANAKNGLSSVTGTGAGQPKSRRISWKFTLNPGKFNMKEHMLIGIAAAAGCSPAYATNVLAIQSLVFNSPLGNLTGIGLVVSSQCIGFSMAWFLFDYVIKPSVMIWPATLVNVSLYNTLHEHKVLTRWFTRMQLFWYAFFAVFIYQWLPRMFMPVLASMTLLCWIKPSSNVLRKLGSGYTGLGIGCISLDWSIISGVGPLYTPWWAQCNFFIGLILMLWIVTPIVYFSNYWSAMSYPIVSSNLYDNSSQLYDVSRIVNKDLSFNVTMYESYSPVIMTPYFAITYGTSFMAVIATFVHVSLFYGSDIWLIAKTRSIRKWQRVKGSTLGEAMSKYFHDSHASSSTGKEPAARIEASVMGHGAIGYSQGYGSSKKTFQMEVQALEGRGSWKLVQKNGAVSSSYITTDSCRNNKIVPQFHSHKLQIPGWWFGIMFVVCFAMAVLVCNTTDIHLPVYALILALLLAAVLALPMAIIQALSSSQIGLNVLSEVVCGYLLPGNQLGNSVFKCYSYMALYQCLNLTQGFKLGHYMKVPPRKIFIAVVYGTLVGAFVNLQVLEWVLLYNRQALFDANPRSGWSFRNLDLFFSASLLWGAISPKRLFAEGSIYHFLPYCFILGILLPIPFYVMYRHYPPHGAMCMGESSFLPFMPKCTCPNDYIAASSEGDTPTTAIFPNPYRSRRHEDMDPTMADNRPSHLEGGRSWTDRTLKNHWPFLYRKQSKHHSERQQALQEEAGLTDKSASSENARPSSSSENRYSSNNSNSNDTTANDNTIPPSTPNTTSTKPVHTHVPHIYHGNPDSTLEYCLRRFPWHLVNTPLICVGASFVPQAPASFVASAGIVAFCFAFLVLRYRHEWWRRYTFVLAAALDAGTQICNMAIFVVFSLILKGAVEFPSWLGNDATNPEKCGVGDGYN
ncbi:hypothetical protein BGZ58_009541 [Dissophora ornata]|nr:hypothetical protein BGZ58_009541 [Dissophora ornata]